MPNNSSKGYKFEQIVRAQFKKAGFSSERKVKFDRDTGHKSEYDAELKKDKFKILVSCKFRKKINIRDEVQRYRTIKIQDNYDKVLFVFKGMQIKEGDFKYANKNEIIIWTSKELRYLNEYIKLFKKNTYKFILYSFDLKTDSKNEYSFIPAIEIKQPLGKFYLTKIDYKQLLKLCYVYTRNFFDKHNKGFQRLANSNRIKKIGDYVSTNHSVIPNSVILSSNLKLEYKDGYLKLQNMPFSFSIIDGQHRIFGFIKKKKNKNKNYELPVSIFEKMKMPDQAKIFKKINEEQRKISTSLIISLFEFSDDKKSKDYLRDIIINKLNSENKSPWNGLIDMDGTDPELTTKSAAFKNALDRTLNNKKYFEYLKQNKYSPNFYFKIIFNLSKAIKSTYKDYWVDPIKSKERENFKSPLNHNLGLRILYGLFLSDYLKYIHKEYENKYDLKTLCSKIELYKYGRFKKLLHFIRDYNWKKKDLRGKTGGWPEALEIYKKMKKKIPELKNI